MRVLFVINRFAMAGAEKLVFDLSKHIIGRCEYVGVAALYGDNDRVEAEMMSDLSRFGIGVFVLGKRAKRDRLKSIEKLRKIAREHQIDLIHAHCSVPMLLSKCAGISLGIPVVCTVHNTYGYSAKRELLTGWMAAHYISIGEGAEQYMLRSLNIPQNKITRIYNAVDMERFQSQERTDHFWMDYGLDDHFPVLLNIGRFTDIKNQICLLKAMTLCRERGCILQSVFLGEYQAEGSTFPLLWDYIQENGLEKQVCFLGVRNDVNVFLNHADCFVMTSRFEGLSVAFLEAVVCGVPIITSDMPFVRELNRLATPFSCSVVFPQNDDTALAQLLETQSYVGQDECVVKFFRELFSMDQFSDKHISVYQNVLESRTKT